MKRIGIYGGTFDPIHDGHLHLAQHLLDSGNFDQVWLMVAKTPPHKAGVVATARQRLEMTRRAAAPVAGLVVSDFELQLAGPSYTRRTLQLLRQAYPSDVFHIVLGIDAALDLPTWNLTSLEVQDLDLWIADRIGYDWADLVKLNRRWPIIPPPHDLDQRCLAADPLEVSSTQVRELLAAGASAVPVSAAVLDYVRSQQLYAQPAPVKIR
jgi:nicotinate-nucleotide adenylyltransferase